MPGPTDKASNLRRVALPAALSVVVAVAALVTIAARPVGEEGPQVAALQAVQERARPGTARVLLRRQWGDGVFVLVGFDRMSSSTPEPTDPAVERSMGLAFTIDQGRGWRVARLTEAEARTDDVTVGSLLHASSPGGSGQPAWSAVFGEVREDRIVRAEVRWATGDVTHASLDGTAYLVLREGETLPLRVRYVDRDGETVAVVPVPTNP